MYYSNSPTRLLAQLSLASIVLASNSSSSSLEQLFRTHPRDLPIKRSTDCGTWTMYCGGVPNGAGGHGPSAEEACNNACYYINQVDPSFVATYRKVNDNGKNRQQSGCQTQQGSVCNAAPFSQRFHDDFESYKSDPNLYEWNCDEFPMAAMSQPDFGTDGRPPNSLRCIRADQNEVMGGQLSAFIAGTGNGLVGRSPNCDGELPDDSTFRIAFNYDNLKPEQISKLGFCKGLPEGGPVPVPDPEYQFHMTKLTGGSSGRINFPYQPNNDNRYAIATTGKDVLQCELGGSRNTDSRYEFTILDSEGNIQGNKVATLTKKGDQMVLPGKNGLLDITITATGPVGDPGTVGSEIQFRYANPGPTVKGSDFIWTTLSTGTDGRLGNNNPDISLPGGYCTITELVEDEIPPTQQIACYFPCNAA